ncbi:hypothetical protein [Ruminococcus sp.]|uniref:hypothetical protein n=1 Tax=Ruminococcus sp. TaxID=41978 RepID=UPI0025ED4288|nr:hypothetical protein [Ruminococcus sp.]
MKYAMIAAAMIGYMLLCGCDGGKDSTSTTDTTTTLSTITVTGTISKKTDDKVTSVISDTEKETIVKKSTDTSSESRLQEVTAPVADVDIVIDGDSAAVTEQMKPSTTKSVTSSDNATGVDNGNVMPDDGLDWTPLTPVE